MARSSHAVLRGAPDVHSLQRGFRCGGGVPLTGVRCGIVGETEAQARKVRAARNTRPLAPKDRLRSPRLLSGRSLPHSSNCPRSSVLNCGEKSPRLDVGSPQCIIPALEAILCRFQIVLVQVRGQRPEKVKQQPCITLASQNHDYSLGRPERLPRWRQVILPWQCIWE